MIRSSVTLSILFLAGTFSMFMINNSAFSRTEQITDDSNNGISISFDAPDNLSSGKLSMTVVSLDWRLNGVFATNLATNLLDSTDQPVAFFVVINTPSLASFVIPLGQKIGLISLALSQYVTIKNESDMTLSDGSSAHVYFISVSMEQLQKLKAPIDKPLDLVLITTQQHDKTYIVLYATEKGKMGQYQSAFESMLHSVTIGTASFSNVGS